MQRCIMGYCCREVLTLNGALCREEIVQVLASNTVEDMESNVERTVAWYKQVVGAQR